MKTIICDIDGTLLDYLHDKPSDERGEHVALPGAVEKMQQWEVMGCRIIIITGRRESERKRTVAELEKARIPYDVLLMGYADSGRVLINDVGKQWIRKYGLALTKELLGIIRSKYGTIPIPNADTTLDGETLRSEAAAEKEGLVTELRESLEATSRKVMMEADKDESEYLQEKLSKVPYPIYIG